MSLFSTIKTIFGAKKESTPVPTYQPMATPTPTRTQATSTSGINLNKTKALGISLAKKNVQDLTAEVRVCMDLSGSMGSLYRSGRVQQTLERLIPLAMKFDDNQSIEAYFFNRNVEEYEPITPTNVENYIRNNRIEANGGTSYAPSIWKMVDDAKNGRVKFPMYVLFVTDGENDDEQETRRALREASKYEIYFQFVGIGNDNLSFLESLDNLTGRAWDNAGFLRIEDMSRVSDEVLYDKLLDEFVEIYKKGQFKTGSISLIKK